MEADERPVKKRRLSQDAHLEMPHCAGESSAPVFTTTNGVEDLSKDEAHVSQNSIEKDTGANGLPAPSEVAPLSNNLDTPTNGPPLSKNQQKKLRKKQEWEAKRDERRVMRKEKEKARKQRKRERRTDEVLEDSNSKEKPTKHKAVQLPITFLIDCDFDDLMRDSERISLAGQITRSYSDNRKAPFRGHLSICSFNGKLRERFDHILAHYKGWKGVKFLDCDFVEAAEKAKEWMHAKNAGVLAGTFDSLSGADAANLQEAGEVVYLTSESDETLTELKPYSTYIIGGLVDKNREKGICYQRATKAGVKTAKLPIREFMDMQSRQVLATNHVHEIMLRWLECGDWGEAFLKVIPKRKGGKLKGHEDEEDDDDPIERNEENEVEGGAKSIAEDEDDAIDVVEKEDKEDDASAQAVATSDS